MSLVNNRDEYYLEHVGVKGMKWGIRKARKGAARRIKKAAGSQAVKTQLGTSDKQKAARKQLKSDIKKAAGSQAVKTMLGTSDKQKAARKQLKSMASKKINTLSSKVKSKGKPFVKSLLVGPNKDTKVNAINIAKFNVMPLRLITKTGR